MTSSASADFSVTISTRASWSTVRERSTSLPSTLPANAALARPAPMDAATSRTLGGVSKDLVLLSGSVIVIMAVNNGYLGPEKRYNLAVIPGPPQLHRGGTGTQRLQGANAKSLGPGSLLRSVRNDDSQDSLYPG